MFSIYIKAPRNNPLSKLIYDDINLDDDFKLIEPKLMVEDNSAGSLEFEVPLCNVEINGIDPYHSDMDIFVYKMGYSKEYTIGNSVEIDDIYWAGRIVSVDKGIDNHKVVYCEGVYGFLNDTIQAPQKYTTTSNPGGNTLETYVEFLLNRHNRKVSDNRKIYKGIVNVTYEPTDWVTNYESTMEIIQDIVSTTNGHIRIRRGTYNNTKVWFLDILTDDEVWVVNEDQQLEYGANILDLLQTYDISEICTIIYPLGKRKDNNEDTGLDDYYTIENADITKIPASLRNIISKETDEDGQHYLMSSLGNPNSTDYIGHYETTVNYDDVEDPTELMLLGILSLTLPDSKACEIEASAIDLSYSDRSKKPLEVYDVIQVYAPQHGVSKNDGYKVSKAEIPLDNPFDGTYTIGNIRGRTFTELTTKNTKAFANEIKYLTVKPGVTPGPTPEPGNDNQE